MHWKRLCQRPAIAVLGSAIVVSAAIALPLTLSAGSAAGATGHSHYSKMRPAPSSRRTRVIILLRDRAAGLAPHSARRIRSLLGEQAPVSALLRSHGATKLRLGRSLPFIVATVSASQRKALASNPLVQLVVPDTTIPVPTSEIPAPLRVTRPRSARLRPRTAAASPSICGTPTSPEVDPEAIGAINSPQANALGYDGAGVSVAYLAGPIDPTIPDLQRNAKYASASSPAGSPVLTPVNFAGDPAGTPGGDVADESFLDASSIAAQGNTVYNLDDFVNSSHSLPSPCDITITGAAPGASVTGLDVFSNVYDTTESNFIQAIDYAVANGVKVLNESFGANNFPDTALDATRIADDDAVAAGVTVVVSSGDAGVTSTIGSPATDPNLISVGASTTFRSYEQNFLGGINASAPNSSNGTWLDNNISSLSSAGFSQAGGNTVDLVAPGDLNWALCSTSSQFGAGSGCVTENGSPSPISQSGGTSESAPLTSGAAADVIQAYASTHGGTDPSPALIKQILMSTATDTDAPGEQQGAGLLNVLAAVKEATSIPGTSGTPQGGLELSPNQINISQKPGASASQRVSVTNAGSSPRTVKLSTRALTNQVAGQSGSFCLNPSSSASGACGPPTANTFQIWSGVTEVYQEETFSVPATTTPSRLNFSADYPFTGQGSLLHVALYDPSGAYAGYSLPQGLADFANIQVSDPKPGTWTAVFFTEQDGATPGGTGTSGTIQWQASTYKYAPGGSISPSTLTIAPGATSTATFTAKSPSTPGDTAQSIVLSTVGGATNTVPVTVRTLVPLGGSGGAFSGVLTGGNGRGNPSQMNTYAFNVPAGKRDLDVSASFADAGDGVVALLQDPQGETVASSSSVTLDNTQQNVISTGTVNVYKDSPEPGTWYLVLDWLQPVSGSELSEPFSGKVQFNRVNVSSNLPADHSRLKSGTAYTFDVRVKNTAKSPEAFFLDPRTSSLATVPLADLNGSDQNMTLPLGPGFTFPLYAVPTDSNEVETAITGSGPVTYDIEAFPGDPDLSPALAAPGVTESQSGDTASLNFAAPGEVYPGIWLLNPSEVGPYGPSGPPTITASDTFDAVTPAFDPTVSTSTGDLWSFYNGITSGFSPVYVAPGGTATIPVTITPTAAPGKVVSGVINLDDAFQFNELVGIPDSGGDELASLPYSYRVSR